MMRCNNCGHKFDEPITIRTNYSSYLGIDYELGFQPLTLHVCPYCESEDIEEDEFEEDEDG